jgi:hypothetical protein
MSCVYEFRLCLSLRLQTKKNKNLKTELLKAFDKQNCNYTIISCFVYFESSSLKRFYVYVCITIKHNIDMDFYKTKYYVCIRY